MVQVRLSSAYSVREVSSGPHNQAWHRQRNRHRCRRQTLSRIWIGLFGGLDLWAALQQIISV